MKLELLAVNSIMHLDSVKSLITLFQVILWIAFNGYVHAKGLSFKS